MRIAVANMKGGVGKSTTTMMLADTLSLHHEKRVLIVDCDPQANCSQMVLSYEGLKEAKASHKTLASWIESLIGRSIYGEKMQRYQAGQTICYDVSELTNFKPGWFNQNPSEGRLSIWPSIPDSRFAELMFDAEHVQNGDLEHPRRVLAQEISRGLKEALTDEEIAIFDCPPGFSTLAQAALLNADFILSPLNVDFVSLWSLKTFWNQGLSDTLKISDRVPRYAMFTMVRNSGGREERMRLRQELSAFANGQRIRAEVSFSVQGLRMATRIAPDSQRSFNEKYGSLRGTVRALGDEVAELISSQKESEN